MLNGASRHGVFLGAVACRIWSGFGGYGGRNGRVGITGFDHHLIVLLGTCGISVMVVNLKADLQGKINYAA